MRKRNLVLGAGLLSLGIGIGVASANFEKAEENPIIEESKKARPKITHTGRELLSHTKEDEDAGYIDIYKEQLVIGSALSSCIEEGMAALGYNTECHPEIIPGFIHWEGAKISDLICCVTIPFRAPEKYYFSFPYPSYTTPEFEVDKLCRINITEMHFKQPKIKDSQDSADTADSSGYN